MSNIIGLSDIQGQRPHNPPGQLARPQPPGSSPYFQGTARRLDGTVVPPPAPPKAAPAAPVPLPQYHRRSAHDDGVEVEQHVVAIDLSGMAPKELQASFWTPNGATPTEFSVAHFCKMAYCPCCVGPCCSEQRRSDWFRLLRMLTFWLMVVQLVLYIVAMARTPEVDGYVEPDLEVLLDFGANSRCKILCHNQYHRLLGYILLHGSIWHILLNFVSEFLFVLPMEAAWGTIKFGRFDRISGQYVPCQCCCARAR
jgi:hypothetical protein